MSQRAQMFQAGGLDQLVAIAEHHLEQLQQTLLMLEAEMRRATIRIVAIETVAQDDLV